jgi:hypothetical protein
MVKISSTVDTDQRAFKSLSYRQDAEGVLEDDRPSTTESDNATLAPGLDGVKGMNDTATKEEIAKGDSTKVTRLVYDEYDASRP